MSPELIKGLISAIIVILIIIFIIRKAIKLAISVAVILLLFNIAFLWNGDTLNEKLGLNEYLSPTAASQVTNFFNDFDSKRDEYGIVDSQAVYDNMTDGIKTGTTIIVKGLGQLDIKKFADTMADKIYETGSENVDWDALKTEIKNQLGDINEDDLNTIMADIKQDVADKTTE